MVKKNWKQIMGLVLATALLTGCASTDVGSQNTETSTGKVESTPVQTEPPSQEVEEELTYPIQTDEKLVIWSNTNLKYSSAYKDATESPFHKGLSERTGVELEWQFPQDGVDTFQAFNLLLTDEKLPDIIFHQISATQAEQLINDGIIYDLTEYIPKYAPDYWEALNSPEYPMLKKSVTTSSGKLFNFASCVEGDYNNTYMGPVIRKDWLDACGLNEPVTLEDWENVLTAFKDKYGATLGVTSGTLMGYDFLQSGTDAFGHVNVMYRLNDAGEVVLAQTQPEWKEYMKVLNRWYENDLIDKDSVTMDTAALRTKAVNGEIGAAFVPSSNLRNFIADAKETANGAEWIGVSYPRVAAGVPTSYIQITSASMHNGKGAVITTSCPEEKLIAALQFLNYGYTEEGHMYWNFGEEGVSYTLDSNGRPQWTELILNDEMGVDEAKKKYSCAHSAVIGFQAEDYIRLNNAAAAGEAIDKWIDNTAYFSNVVPTDALTDEENLVYTDKYAAVQSYLSETALKFIVGDESLDKFDAFVEELNKIGLKECIEIVSAAHKRYLGE